MKTITVKMPEAVAARLERKAQRLGRAKSALVREAVERILDDAGDDEIPTAYERMSRGLGCVATGVGDLSTNPKHLEGFGS